MTLSCFLKIMYSCLGKNKNIHSFVLEIFDSLIQEDIENPLTLYKKNSIYKLYNGKFNLSKEVAQAIHLAIDKDNFYFYLDEFNDTQLDNVINEFRKNNIYINKSQCIDRITDLFALIIKKLYVPTVDITFLDKRPTLKALPSETYFENGSIFMNKEEFIFDDVNLDNESTLYINKLLEYYSFKSNKDIKSIEYLALLPKKFKRNFKEQVESYKKIMTIKHNIIMIFEDGEYEFNTLVNEVYDYIQSSIELNDVFGATTKKTMDCNISRSRISNIKGLIGNAEKKGIVHLLVNMELIPSWVSDE